jgi:hypothetical protein
MVVVVTAVYVGCKIRRRLLTCINSRRISQPKGVISAQVHLGRMALEHTRKVFHA